MLCECGCGEPTPIAKMTNRRYGHVKGQPVRFVRGHQNRRPLEVRFWEKVRKRTDDCWEWTGGRLPKGYGYIGTGGRGTARVYAHRLSYELTQGTIPDGLVVDHLCGNPWCVNPEHLKAVDVRTNVRRQRTSKLTDSLAAEIRASAESNRQLAKRYGVDRSVISRVRSGQAWRS